MMNDRERKAEPLLELNNLHDRMRLVRRRSGDLDFNWKFYGLEEMDCLPAPLSTCPEPGAYLSASPNKSDLPSILRS